MAESTPEPERIAVDPPQQAMTFAQLQAHAAQQHAQIAGDVAPTGLTPEHTALVNAMIGRTRSLLASLAGISEGGTGDVQMFSDQEDANEGAVDSLEPSIPKLA